MKKLPFLALILTIRIGTVECIHSNLCNHPNVTCSEQDLVKIYWNLNGLHQDDPQLIEAIRQCFKKSFKNSHFHHYEPTLILKPLVIRFCPLNFFSDSFRSFYTVNNQNLKKSEKIYKGQKQFTKGFLAINVARFARKIENV